MCVRDPSRIKIKDAILGNTGAANRAGFELRSGYVARKKSKQPRRMAAPEPELSAEEKRVMDLFYAELKKNPTELW